MNFSFLKRSDGYYDMFADACLEAEKAVGTSSTLSVIASRRALELAPSRR